MPAWQKLEDFVDSVVDLTLGSLKMAPGIKRTKQTTNVTIDQADYNSATQLAQLDLSESGDLTEDSSKTTVDAFFENTGSTNALDFAIRGRYNDGTDTSNWEVLAETTAVAAGASAHLSVDRTAVDEIELAAKENSGGSSSTAQGYGSATGA